MSQTALKDLLKNDFGFDIDIAGGLGQSPEDPIIVLSTIEDEAVKNELLVLRGIGLGRGILWKSLKTTNLKASSGPLIQRKIETKDVQAEQIITQTENYYFRRTSVPSGHPLPQSVYIVHNDHGVGIAFPYELSWLHFDDIVDYEQRALGLGYSLAYNAPGIWATVYVYPTSTGSSAPANYLDELENARNDIILRHGENAIDRDWKVQDRQDHAFYYFVPAYKSSTTSLLLVALRQGHFIKVRCSFVDDPLLRNISDGFISSILELIRNQIALKNGG